MVTITTNQRPRVTDGVSRTTNQISANVRFRGEEKCEVHRSGVPVTVPSPERYAVPKLIVASRRQSDANGIAKREKDVH